ncbi:hypothetical protein BJ546DRAFT_106112 [Cryomyces antarcticus]
MLPNGLLLPRAQGTVAGPQAGYGNESRLHFTPSASAMPLVPTPSTMDAVLDVRHALTALADHKRSKNMLELSETSAPYLAVRRTRGAAQSWDGSESRLASEPWCPGCHGRTVRKAASSSAVWQGVRRQSDSAVPDHLGVPFGRLAHPAVERQWRSRLANPLRTGTAVESVASMRCLCLVGSVLLVSVAGCRKGRERLSGRRPGEVLVMLCAVAVLPHVFRALVC